MPQVLAAHNLELHEVESRLQLQQSTEPAFFPEWQGVAVELDERDGRQSLLKLHDLAEPGNEL